MEKMYLEDLNVGDTFKSSTYTFSEADIIEFAKQYDPQVFHLDSKAAKDTFFAGLAASGWQTASITMRLMVESIPIATGLIGAGGNIKWGLPTRVGDTIRVESEIVAIKRSKSKPNQAIVTVQINTVNQNGDYAQQFECNMLAFDRPSK